MTGVPGPARAGRRQRGPAHDGRRPGDGRRRAPAPTWCTATPGTPTWPGTWPSCCTACRTWSPRTAWSRCARGRPSSSAAATRSRPGCERTALESADAVIAVSAGMRRDVLGRLPGGRPGPGPGGPQRHRHRAVHARPRHRRARAARHRPGPAERRLRRPDHPAEGAAVPAARGRGRCPPEVQLVLLAGAPDTPEIAAEVETLAARCSATRERRDLGPGDAAQAARSSRC